MADNVTIPTTGSGSATPVIATEDVSGVHFQLVTTIGTQLLANGQVSVTGTAGTVVAARAKRRSVTIINHGIVDVFLGIATVTAANGALLPGVKGAAITFHTTALIQGIAASAQTVSYFEEYD